MDYEKLIEQLKQKDGLWCSVPTGEKLVTDAAAALTALLAENGWVDIACQKDYGGNDRAVTARRSCK